MIYDLDNNVILSSPNIALHSGESTICSVLIDCETGFSLFGQAVADMSVEARHGVSGSWTNLETTPIDLGTWNGSREVFQIQLTAGAISTFERQAFPVKVRRPT